MSSDQQNLNTDNQNLNTDKQELSTDKQELSTDKQGSNIYKQGSNIYKQELSTTCEVVIDCAPLTSRPDTILISILKNTNLSLNDFVKTSSSFGAWTFIPLKEKESLYLENQKLIGEKLTKLYNSGQIRSAEW